MPKDTASRLQLLTGAALGLVGLATGLVAAWALCRHTGGRATGVILGTLGGLVLAVTATGVLIIRWIGRRWINPITRLSRKVDDVERGNLDVSVREDRDDEIGELARLFNAMLEGVRRAREQSVELARKQANIEKFAALGRLSAGVAHEINNPLGGILTCVETLKSLEPGSDRYDDYLNLIKSGLERIGSIVGQLLRFARQPAGKRQDVDLNRLLEEVIVLSNLQNRDQNVEVVRRFGALPTVRGAPDLLNQLFLNLVLNAMQAMPDGGTLTLMTWAEDGVVHALLDDTGPGIPEEHLERIFEPFFTTKGVGVGTGLGLSVALGIVEAHGGGIEARNRSAGGTRFIVRLPTDAAAPAGRPWAAEVTA